VILTISNLFPRPDEPQRGLFNLQLFERLHRQDAVHNICLVPSYKMWSWPAIRAWDSPQAAAFRTSYTPVFYIPLLGRTWSWITYLLSLRAAGIELDAVDVLYAAWLYPDGVVATRLAGDKPVWLMVQGSDIFHLKNPIRRRLIRDACERAAGVICVSSNLADQLAENGIDPERIHVVHNGVDGDRFRYRDRTDARAALRSSAALGGMADLGDQPLALFVGHLVPVKGPDILLQSWAQVRIDSPEAHLVFAGEGMERPSLEAAFRDRGIGDRVHFVGALDQDSVAVLMAAADVLCLPSRSEGMPNAMLEALATGLPVVATDVGCCREILDPADGCAIVPREDATALADAMRTALEAVPDRRALADSQRGRFSWDRQAQGILELMNGATR
jgi:teichuronic acid biosynthesis glycosyltransferase TuaC